MDQNGKRMKLNTDPMHNETTTRKEENNASDSLQMIVWFYFYLNHATRHLYTETILK